MEEDYRIASCEGKVPFATWSLANDVAKRRASNGKKGNVYKCSFCRKFHIGRKPKLKRRTT